MSVIVVGIYPNFVGSLCFMYIELLSSLNFNNYYWFKILNIQNK